MKHAEKRIFLDLTLLRRDLFVQATLATVEGSEHAGVMTRPVDQWIVDERFKEIEQNFFAMPENSQHVF